MATPTTSTARRRVSPLLLPAALLVGAALWWLFRPTLPVADLGAGELLVARPGCGTFVVGDGAGAFHVFPASATSRADGVGCPDPGPGGVHVDAEGRVLVLQSQGVVRATLAGGVLQREVLPLDAAPPAEWRLVGVDGAGEPVLAADALAAPLPIDDGPPAAAAPGPALLVRVRERFVVLADAGGRAAPPAGAPLVLSPNRRALAFRPPSGWEVWAWGEDGTAVRRTSSCTGPVAVFTPDGAALVTDGPVDGLWRIELASDRQGHMAVGNLGHSPRLPWSAGFRGAPVMLVAPQWLHGWLHVFQTHLSGGGRLRFTTGNTHHYLPALSADGRHLAYAQSALDPEGDEPFVEELWLFDFQHPGRNARPLGERAGGRAHQGPLFPDEHTVVWIADGRVRLARPSLASPGDTRP